MKGTSHCLARAIGFFQPAYACCWYDAEDAWIANHQSPYWRRRLAVLVAASLEELSSYSDVQMKERVPLPVPIQQALEFMEEHLGEPITIEEIAARSGWSHEHFTRVFVVSLGMTPKRMSLRRRAAQSY